MGIHSTKIQPMKQVILIVPVLALAACEATSPAPATPAPTAAASAATASTGPDTCGAEQFDGHIGKPVYSMESLTVPPGGLRDMREGSTPSNLDNPERLNLVVDEQGNVIRAFCG